MRGRGLASVVLLLGCDTVEGFFTAEPEATFRAMVRAACASDSTAFFEKVDRERLERSLGEIIQTNINHGGNDLAKKAAPAVVPRLAKETTDKVWLQWGDDISEGSSGELCGAEFVVAGGDEDDGWVDWKTRVGADKTWVFRRLDGTWKLVGVREVEP